MKPIVTLQDLEAEVTRLLTQEERQVLGPDAVGNAVRVLLRTCPFTQRTSFSREAFFKSCCTLPEYRDLEPDSPQLPKKECQTVLDVGTRMGLLAMDPDNPERLVIRDRDLHNDLRRIYAAL